MHFPSSVIVTEQTIDLSHLNDRQKDSYTTLSKDIAHMFSVPGKSRMIFGFAGISGAGKSTLTAIVKTLLSEKPFRVEQLSIDAYHFTNADLATQGLLSHKGRYDTYNIDLLKKDLARFKEGGTVQFPEYSRKTHEPTLQGGSLWAEKESGILLVEGLWLLYKEGSWGSIKELLDVSYFVDEGPSKAKEKTVARHVRGGRSQNDAEVFYKESDAKNAQIVETTRGLADRILRL